MELLARAWTAMKLNQAAVMSYVGCCTLLGIAQFLAFDYLRSFVDGDGPAWVNTAAMGIGLCYALLLSVLQTLCFAYLARSIDRPLWKISGPGDALKRFFLTWFLLNLILFFIFRLTFMADQKDLYGMLMLLLVLYYIPYLPIGAAIMFAGRYREWRLIDAIAPFGRRLVPTLTIFLVMFFLYILNMLMVEMKQPTVLREVVNHAAFSFLLSGMEILVFSATWLLCIDDRNAETDEPQDPFDF